jgi:predicted glycosyltransferase
VRIWIDLAGPPQVLFFRPIAEALRRDGHELFVTVRDFAHAPELAARFGFDHLQRVVGRHGGRGSAAKGLALLMRAVELASQVRHSGPQLALSHNSYAQAVAAKLLRIPLVTAMDHEHQPANHVSFRAAHRVLVPEAFPEAALRRYGAGRRAVVRYPGVKEEVYLADFVPDPHFPADFGLPADRIVVSMRPPPQSAIYHRFANPLFDAAVEHLARLPRTLIVLLDRDRASHWSRFANVHVPDRAIDGPNLVYCSDVFVGGGGTMNREAAVLGTPAYSVYAGKPLAVDGYLIARGQLKRLESVAELSSIALEKKSTQRTARARSEGLSCILGAIRGAIVSRHAG